MATTNVVFNGIGKTHDSTYSIRRFLYYWPVENLSEDPVSVTLAFSIRSDTTISNKSYKLVLFKDINIIEKENWKYRNGNSYYQYPSSTKYYFDTDYYTNFCGSILATIDCDFSVTGGAGNISKVATFDIPVEYQDKSVWNGENIFFGIVDNSGEYSPDLCWGRSVTCDMTLTCKTGPAFHYYNDNSMWQDISNAWYYDGTSWVKIYGVSSYDKSSM